MGVCHSLLQLEFATWRTAVYAMVEQECLAIKLGIKAFSVYLMGKPFSVQTDHRVLKWLNSARRTMRA